MTRSRVRRSSPVAGLLLLVLLVTACGGGRELPDLDVGATAAGVAAPAERDVLVEGGWPLVASYVAEAAAADRPVVVNLFASWCAPCEEELPLLLAASDRHEDVAWLGVATRDVAVNAAPFVEATGIDWPTVLDVDATTHEALLGRVMPTTAFFDRDGRLVEVVDGIVTERRLADALARITG